MKINTDHELISFKDQVFKFSEQLHVLIDHSYHRPLKTYFYWILRLAVAFEFIGHGAFGVITKAAWLPYFAVLSIPEEWAWRLMPLVGTWDIFLGLSILFHPTRPAILYMACWGFITALLRPLAGESWWEFWERSYNYGIPFLFLLIHGHPSHFKWGPSQVNKLGLALRFILFCTLLAHGLFFLFLRKQNLLQQMSMIDEQFPSLTLNSLMTFMGGVELLMATSFLFMQGRALKHLCILAFIWKIFTESLYPFSGMTWGIWEFVERASAYGAPLGLLLVTRMQEKMRAFTIL